MEVRFEKINNLKPTHKPKMDIKTPVKRVLFPRCLKVLGLGLFMTVLFSLAAIFTLAPTANATTSNTVNFQARLMNASGSIVPDGSYNIEFKLYDASGSSGSSQGSCTGDSHCLWDEDYLVGSSQGVNVTNGYLSVSLGSINPFSNATNPINWGKPLYLTINIGGTSGSPSWDGEMSPRIPLTSVPAAFALESPNAGSFTSTLSFVQPTASEQILLPAESGATEYVCYQNDTACGFESTTGTDFIQNQNASPQTANFNISGTGQAGTLEAGTFDRASAGTLNVGTTNATAITLGSVGVTTTDAGSLTVNGSVTANGIITQTSSLNTTGSITSITVTNTNTSSTQALVGGISIHPVGTANSNSNANILEGIFFNNVTTLANNSFYALNFGTGYNDLLRYNGAQLISGTGILQNAAISATTNYSNLDEVGALSSGSITTGFGTISTNNNITTSTTLQGGTVLAGTVDATGAGSANTLTIGSTASTTGAINLGTSMTSGTVTVGGTNQTGNITIGQYNGASTSNIYIGANAGSSTQQDIDIGDSANGTDYVTIGSTSSTSQTKLRGGGTSETLTNSGDSIKTSTNSATALQVQNNNGYNELNVDTSGNKVTLGNITSTSGHGIAGALVLADGTADNFGATLNTTTLTTNQTISLPNASGTICLQTSTACGFESTTGTDFIQNQNASPQTANFNITGSGVAGNFQATNYILTPNIDTASAGTLTIGPTNATAITIGSVGVTTTDAGSLTVNGLLASTGLITQNYSLATTGSAMSLTATNTNTTSTSTSVGTISIHPVGTANGNSNANIIQGIFFNNVTTLANNSFYALNFGTGYNDLLRYNGAQLISGAGILQNAAISNAVNYSNLAQVGALSSGSITTGFGTISTNNNITTSATLQGGTVLAGTVDAMGAGSANTLTIGSSATTTGAITVGSSMTTGVVTVGGTAQTGNITIGQYNGSGTSAINVGANAGASSTQNINVGTSTNGTNAVTVGSTSSTSTTKLQAGATSETLSNTGDAIKTTTNSTTAFQIQNSNGSSGVLLNADTSNMRVSIGSAGTATAQLYVSGTVPTAALYTSGSLGGAPWDIKVVGNYAYIMVDSTSTLKIYDVSNPASPVSVGSVSMANAGNYLAVAGKYAYVTETTGSKLEVFDISNPRSPVSVGSVTTGTTPNGVYVQGKYAYVVNGGSNNLQVIDVSNPTAPTVVGTASFSSGTGPQGVFVLGNFAYVASTSTQAFTVVNISNPTSPAVTGTPLTSGTLGANSKPYDVYVQGHYAYLTNNGSSGHGSMQVIDLSNPSSMTVASTVTTGDSATGVYVQGHYAYVTTYNGNTLEVIDVSTPASAATVGTYSMGSVNASNIVIQGRYAYVSDTGTNKFQVFDLGGAYVQQLQAGGVETSTLDADGNAVIQGDASIQGGLTVGGNTELNGNVGVSGSALFENNSNSTTAFQVQNAAAANIFSVDTTDGYVIIGTGSTGESTPKLLVLDNGNTSSDPTGVTGAMYYNAALDQYRCYYATGWQDCTDAPIDQSFDFSDDFIAGGLGSGSIGELNWDLQVIGGATVSSGYNSGSVAALDPSASHPGTYKWSNNNTTPFASTGATVSLGASGASTPAPSMFTNSGMDIKSTVAVTSVASTGLIIRDGIDNETTGTARGTSGVFWEFDPGQNSGKWELCNGNNAAPVCVDSGVTAAANTWYRLEIQIVSSTNVIGYINGTKVTNTNAVDFTTNLVSPAMTCLSTATATAQNYCYVDYYQIRGDISSPR